MSIRVYEGLPVAVDYAKSAPPQELPQVVAAHETSEMHYNPPEPDEWRFAEHIRTHLPTMLRVAGAIVGPADAEDAAQEAITRAWQAWGALRDASALRAWLLRITVNVCKDWQRGRFGTRRRLTEPLPENDQGLPVLVLGSDPGASDHAASLDLRRAIMQLDDDLRLIVVLRYYAGMDATQVGAILGIPSATVRTRLRRGLRQLRDLLAGEAWPRYDTLPRAVMSISPITHE